MSGVWIDSFLENIRTTQNYSNNTVIAYQNDLSQFFAYLQKEHKNKTITAEIVETYINELRDRSYASSTIARKVAAIKTFLTYLHDEGHLETDISRQVDTPRVERQTQTLLTHEEVEELLAYPSQSDNPRNLRNQVLLYLLYTTDLKINELVDLRTNNYDGHYLVLSENGNGKKRKVVLSDSTQQHLNTYLESGRPLLDKGKDDDALFLNHRGQALTRQGLWLIIKSSAEAVGLPDTVTPHTLQRSYSEHQE